MRLAIKQVSRPRLRQARTIAVTSGKGGVGKTNFTVNFGIQLAKGGYRVVVFDADIGMANMDVLMGLSPRYTLYDLLRPDVTVFDVMEQGPQGILLVPGSSGFQEQLRLTPLERSRIVSQLQEVGHTADFILVDTGAGMNEDSAALILAADEIILITTPEPTAVTDGYAVMKYLFSQQDDLRMNVVINRVQSRKEAEVTGHNIETAVNTFLERDVRILGHLPDHPDVARAVKRQRPFSECYPNSRVTRHLQVLSRGYLAQYENLPRTPGKGILNFFHSIVRRRS